MSESDRPSEEPQASDDQEAGDAERLDDTPNPAAIGADPGASRWVALLVWTVQHGKSMLAAVGGAGLLAVWILDLQIPRWLQVGGITAAVLGPTVGLWTGKKANELLGGPSMIWIVDFDLLDLDGAGIYRCPTPRWQEWEVVDGELTWATPNLAFGKAVDTENQTLEGTWPGTISDRELMQSLTMLRRCRNQLEEDAKRGFELETNGFSIIRSATRATVRHVVKTFERGTLPDEGDALHAEIDTALEEFGIEDQLANGDLDGDPDDGQPSVDFDASLGDIFGPDPEAADD